jgi:zinc transport system substrate-binding protein
MKPQSVTLSLLVLVLATACTRSPDEHKPAPGPNSTKPVIYTDFYPTQYFTQRIAGDIAEVICPVPPDEDAIFWKPDADTIARYQKADLIVLNGAGFAKWVTQTTLPDSRVIETANPFKPDWITFENAVVHKHGNEGEHSHEGLDGHTWIDPVNAKAQAEVIKDEVIRRWPEHKDAFESGFTTLAADLDQLDRGFRALDSGVPILTSHPAYNYISRRYGWKIHNLNLDPGQMPDDETFARIKEILSTFAAGYVLWESVPTPEIATRFQDELALTSKVFSPCELKDTDDYLTVMRSNLATMQSIFADK